MYSDNNGKTWISRESYDRRDTILGTVQLIHGKLYAANHYDVVKGPFWTKWLTVTWRRFRASELQSDRIDPGGDA